MSKVDEKYIDKYLPNIFVWIFTRNLYHKGGNNRIGFAAYHMRARVCVCVSEGTLTATHTHTKKVITSQEEKIYISNI